MTAFWYVFLPVGVFVVYVLVQIGLARWVFRTSLLKATLFSFATGFMGLILIELYFLKEIQDQMSLLDGIGYVITHLVIYVSLGYCYINFINLGETARRIRLLRELSRSENGLPLEELLRKYNASEIIERRIGRLMDNGQIRLEGGRYYIRRRFMILTAQGIVALKKFILGKASEFD